MSTAREKAIYGGGVRVQISADRKIDPEIARYWAVTATTSGLSLKVPASSRFADGGPWLTVSNVGGTHSITLRRPNNTVLTTLAAGNTVEIYALFGSFVVIALGTVDESDFELPPVLDADTVEITENTFNVNARDLFNARGYAGQTPFVGTVAIGAGVHIGSADSNLAAFDTGAWPGGVSIVIQMGANSSIDGRGGKGGNAGVLFNSNGQNGAAGGTALRLQVDTELDAEAGTALRGGGGGGGGAPSNVTGSFRRAGGGGGGGQGRTGGLGGFTMFPDLTCLPAPDGSTEARAGDVTGPGSGGIGNKFDTGISACTQDGLEGGVGGAWGSAGQAGESFSPGVGGSGGAAGKSVEGVSFLAAMVNPPETILGPST